MVGDVALLAAAVATPDRFRRATRDERAARVDDEPLLQGFAADKHPKAHFVAIAQGGLGSDGALTQFDFEQHHDAFLTVTGRAAHRTAVVHWTLDLHHVFRRPLPWTHPEPHQVAARQFFDPEGVQRRTAGPGVELRLDPGHADAGQAGPFAPPHDGA